MDWKPTRGAELEAKSQGPLPGLWDGINLDADRGSANAAEEMQKAIDTLHLRSRSSSFGADLFWNRRVLTSPYSPAVLVNNANRRHLLRNVQANKKGHR